MPSLLLISISLRTTTLLSKYCGAKTFPPGFSLPVMCTRVLRRSHHVVVGSEEFQFKTPPSPSPRVLLFFPRGETRERGASPSLPPPLTSPLFPPPREEDSGDLVRTICQRTERRKKKRRRRRSSFPVQKGERDPASALLTLFSAPPRFSSP